MDFTAFSNSSFNAKNWINKTLKVADEEEDKDFNVSSLLNKLQVYYKKVNNELEETSQNVLNNLPRVLHDIENISIEAATLKQKMSAVKQEIANVEKSTGASIASLEKIDKIKVQLVNAKQALYEADNWTVLSNDIETVFETGDIDVIASKLVSMQQSLNVLSNSSDYEIKKVQLDGLKNRLEALASPYVVEALTTKSAEQAKRFVKIFEDMGRFPLLVKYYSKCQKASLIQQWQVMADLDSDENLVESFQNFYDMLLRNWQEQIKWCEDIIPKISAVEVLVDLYGDLLNSLGAEFSQAIEDNLKRMEDPLSWLLTVKNCSKSFATDVKSKVFTSPVSRSNLLNLAKAVYFPFVSHISKYAALQKSAFSVVIGNLTKDEELMDTVQTLNQKNSRILSTATENLKLCMLVSEGCGLPGYLVALESFLIAYLDVYRNISSAVKDNKAGETEVNTFQMCVTVLQNLGDLANSLKQLDQDCVEVLISSSNNFKKSDSDPFSAFLDLLLDPKKQREFTFLVDSLSDSSEPLLLKSCHVTLETVCREVYQTCFAVIFSTIRNLLEAVPSVPGWRSKAVATELPDYSFAPQEYITQIGQYLMNLPQLLEPFLSYDNPSLNLALTIVGGEYTQLGGEDSESGGFVELFLGRIAEATCRTYCDHILTISSLGNNACKQLATDINYLENVLEDLGFTLSDKLKNIALLIKFTPAEYSTQSAGISPQLVAAVRQMRNIISD